MPKYNPKNKQHRKTLAKRITKMLEASGFSKTHEYTHTTPIVYWSDGEPKIEVFTKIWTNEMDADADAIAVRLQGASVYIFEKVVLKGDMDGITARLLRAISKTRRGATKKKPAPTHDFKVGDLVHAAIRTNKGGENWKGMCKVVNAGFITVFWFHSGKTIEFPGVDLRPLMAA
jgi:hypothetical protein